MTARLVIPGRPDPLSEEPPLPWWLPTPEVLAERERLRAGRYFLVKISGNGGLGEIWRCRRCDGKHRYLTLMCVEQPFSGLTAGIFAYYHTVGANDAASFLNPAELARLAEIGRLINGGRPDVATAHPGLAKSLGTGPQDADKAAVALGILEQIPVTLAREFAGRINQRIGKPQFILPGPAGEGV